MSKELILALDNGTQSVRALAFNLQGDLIDKARVPIQPYFSQNPGWAEQHPSHFWESLCQACHQLWEQAVVSKGDIACVTLTSQRGTVVNVDRNGKSLRPAIIWLDQRRTLGLKPVGGLWGLAFRLTGMTETVAYLQAEAEANWIRTYEPEVWNQTYKYLLLSGYLTYCLTGCFADSVACQVGYIPFDYKNNAWAAKSDWKWQAEPIDPDLLPELVPPTHILGEITNQASEATGIPRGLPLVAAAADKACEVIGSGCLESHIGCLSFGTTATICTTHKKYIEPIPLIPPYPSAVPDAYCLEIQINRGYWMVKWFKEEFAQRECQVAQEQAIEPEELFDELIEQVPAGSMGLILQPYWSPGLKIPGPEAKGAIIGFGDVHGRAHFYQAILEGLAYALLEGKERMEKRSHVPITELRIAGGGSQSDSAMQITADVFGLTAARPHIYEASGLGAAITASVGLGLHPDFSAAIAEMTHTGMKFEPNFENHKTYDLLYRQVYKNLYEILKPLYDRIREITGYPPQFS